MRPVVTGGAVVVLLCGAAFGYARLTGAPELTRSTHARSAVTINGHVEDLHPGVPMTLEAQARNNLRTTVELRGVRTTVAAASPDCPGSLVQADEAHARTRIPPHKRRPVEIRLMLSRSAPDACQNVTFPLRFEAMARRRGGGSVDRDAK
jgi:hypothetical protein